jgi:hypothetical protein
VSSVAVEREVRRNKQEVRRLECGDQQEVRRSGGRSLGSAGGQAVRRQELGINRRSGGQEAGVSDQQEVRRSGRQELGINRRSGNHEAGVWDQQEVRRSGGRSVDQQEVRRSGGRSLGSTGGQETTRQECGINRSSGGQEAVWINRDQEVRSRGIEMKARRGSR